MVHLAPGHQSRVASTINHDRRRGRPRSSTWSWRVAGPAVIPAASASPLCSASRDRCSEAAGDRMFVLRRARGRGDRDDSRQPKSVPEKRQAAETSSARPSLANRVTPHAGEVSTSVRHPFEEGPMQQESDRNCRCHAPRVRRGTVGAVPAGATAPGTNGRIAYSRFAGYHADIVSANPDGTGVVKLTNPPAKVFDLNPDWSPDGTKIAFERDTGVSQEIFTMNADGSDLQQVTFDGFPGDTDPCLVPGRHAHRRRPVRPPRRARRAPRLRRRRQQLMQVTQSGARGEYMSPSGHRTARNSSSRSPATPRDTPSSR